jgi:hypothetical protein
MVFRWHWCYPCAAEIIVDYLCSPTALLSWNSFPTHLSHLLATYTDLLLSCMSQYLVAFGISILAISVSHASVSASLILQCQHYLASVSLASLRTHFFESTQVSIIISFIILHSLYPHQYHHYSYTPTDLFISTHTFIPCRTRLLWAMLNGLMSLTITVQSTGKHYGHIHKVHGSPPQMVLVPTTKCLGPCDQAFGSPL